MTLRSYVQAEIDRFTPDGFEYESLHSFVLEGEFDSLGIDARITIFALEYKPAPMERVIYVRHLEIDGTPIGVAAEEVVFSDESPGDEYDQVVEGVWGRNLQSAAVSAMLIADVASYKTPGAPLFDWKKWGACTLGITLGGCVRATGTCVATGPGYGHCVGAGCAFSALGGMVTCAAFQIF